MNEKCRTCKYWLDLMSAYEDELEPDDFGFCYNDNQGEDMTPMDYHCSFWESNL